MGFEEEGTYVLKCPERCLSWELIGQGTSDTGEDALAAADVHGCRRSPTHLPAELWHLIHQFATPMSRWNLSMASWGTRVTPFETQKNLDKIWISIFRSEIWTSKMHTRDIDVVLISCHFEQLLSADSGDFEKPYVVLALSTRARSFAVHGDDFLSDLRSKHIDVARMEADFPSFTLNFQSVLIENSYAHVPLSSGLLRGDEVKVLSYRNSGLLPARSTGFPGMQIYISEDSTRLERYSMITDMMNMGSHHRSIHTGLREFLEGRRSFETLRNLESSYSCQCSIEYAEQSAAGT